MYDYRCKDCENIGQNMPMANMPMANMPMANMPMANMPMTNMPMTKMPMMNMPMMNMPMMNMAMMNMSMMNMAMMNMPMMNMPMMNMAMHDEDDEDLKSMYPKIYRMIYPMVKKHCDMMESKYGPMYCPSKDEMEHMCKEVSDKCEKHYRDDDDNDDEDMRDTRRQGRRGPIQDLTRILFIRDLLGRRRRRRRGRMFHHGY
ncbi:hypothetical protein G9F73_008955 [Clostridium estertheticum]|uniref:hypothetical protein n=1 Tax=Clostridium estertheticum TaxID=238834 RepID=UPI0013EE56CF|nr:hypothetical protein [Clostridium estertheticum]MBZ9607934.1 hypothetical protein [Clostridium estertheticum]